MDKPHRSAIYRAVLTEAFRPLWWWVVDYFVWSGFSYLLEKQVHWYGWVIGCLVITIGLILRGAVRHCRNVENAYGTQLAEARADRDKDLAKAMEVAKSMETERLAAKIDELLMDRTKESAAVRFFIISWIAEQVNAREDEVLEALRSLKSRGKIHSDASETGWTVPMMRRMLS
jgi:hypothetical protein